MKKLIASLLALTTLATVTIVPMNANAIIQKDDNTMWNDETLKYYEENAIMEAIIIVDDEGYPNYYLNNGVIVPIDDDFDTSTVETTINVADYNNYVPVDTTYGYYTNFSYDYEYHEICLEESTIQKPTIGDSNTIGESEEPQPTGIRGDINYDGNVDGKDLMLLKKYILGLITW